MSRALQLARQGEGRVEPNPMVGSVLVADGACIGAGFHAMFGGPHAEAAAIANARELGNATRLSGCTAYVTLEPCCHQGKTPPCTRALLDAGVARVVVAMPDPFPQVAGQGIELLREAGVAVHVGLHAAQAEALNAAYLKRIQTGRPWVIAKWAMSLDGKIATRTGHSQWISSDASRAIVQQTRGRVDAILIGSATALADNPLLTARTPEPAPRRALRVVADSTLQVPLNSRLVQTAADYPTLLWAGPQASPTQAAALRSAGCQVHVSTSAAPDQRLDELLQYLASERQATNLLVEGGGRLLGSLLELGQIDQCDVFVAPKLLGSLSAPSPIAGLGFAQVDDGPRCHAVEYITSGPDLLIRCRLAWHS